VSHVDPLVVHSNGEEAVAHFIGDWCGLDDLRSGAASACEHEKQNEQRAKTRQQAKPSEWILKTRPM
jgi:hypothetical protein